MLLRGIRGADSDRRLPSLIGATGRSRDIRRAFVCRTCAHGNAAKSSLGHSVARSKRAIFAAILRECELLARVLHGQLRGYCMRDGWIAGTASETYH